MMPGARSLASLLRLARRWRAVARSSSFFPLARPVAGGLLEGVEVEPSGRILALGHARHPEAVGPLSVRVDGRAAEPRAAFSLPRRDLARLLRADHPMLGFAREFAVPAGADRVREVTVEDAGAVVGRVRCDVRIHRPDYASLFDEPRVLHRADVYCSGPPMAEAHPDVVALARRLPGPILDLGCGSGALVRALRAAGVEARGLEVDRPEIVASLRDDVRPHVTLYDGALPLPFGDGAFGSAVCSEVLEHLEDAPGAVREMARVAREALVTVPDMSAVPALHRHGVVPWHLLEATHLGFFTQSSLEALLRQHYGTVRFARLGPLEVNGTRVFTSLVAVCSP